MADSRYSLPVFYLGVLDEADEDWLGAQGEFLRFLALQGDSDLSKRARLELSKLSQLIEQDSTSAGKLNRRYNDQLSVADLLQKKGFSKEALLETANAAKLVPSRWEAYAVASAIMLSQHRIAEANHWLLLARERAPLAAQKKLAALDRLIQAQ